MKARGFAGVPYNERVAFSRDWRAGMTYADLKAKYGITRSAIDARRRAWGLARRRGYLRRLSEGIDHL